MIDLETLAASCATMADEIVAHGSSDTFRYDAAGILADSPADPRQLADGMACTPERLAGELRTLLDKGEIRTMPDGRLALSGDPDNLGRAN